MNPFAGTPNFDAQDAHDAEEAAEAFEAEQRFYLATRINGAIEIPEPSDYSTHIDDARTELDRWVQECIDAGQSDLVPTLCVVRGLTEPVVLFWGSARRVA